MRCYNANTVKKALIYARELIDEEREKEKISCEMSKIAKDFVIRGLTLEETAKEHRICEKYVENGKALDIGTARNIVRFTLGGYEPKETDDERILGGQFEGLLPRLEYDYIAKSHADLSHSFGDADAAWKVGPVFNDAGEYMGAYWIPEIRVAQYLSTQEGFVTKERIRTEKIADALNKMYHDGQAVRDGSGVSKKLCLFNKKLEKMLKEVPNLELKEKLRKEKLHNLCFF